MNQNNLSEKKLVLYGAGIEGRRWLRKLGGCNIFKFADSDLTKSESTIEGIECLGGVEAIKEIRNEIKIFLSVSDQHVNKIRLILTENGLDNLEVQTPYMPDIVRTGGSGHIKIDVETIFKGNNYLDNSCVITDSYIGYSSYIAANTVLQHVRIGKYCAIGPDVSIVRGQHPSKKFVSIHPAFYSPHHEATNIHYCSRLLFEEYRYTKNGYTAEIGNDVWIGQGVKIMEGTTIGNGVIIASGGVVVEDVPPYTIVGGVPARIIRDRFSEKEKKFLEELRWWDKPQNWIQKYASYFSDIEKFMITVQKEDHI